MDKVFKVSANSRGRYGLNESDIGRYGVLIDGEVDVFDSQNEASLFFSENSDEAMTEWTGGLNFTSDICLNDGDCDDDLDEWGEF